jgi:hypothetical protein
MENTLSIKFENDQAEWFVAIGDHYDGPFKAAEIYQKLVVKEISWIDFCYRHRHQNQKLRHPRLGMEVKIIFGFCSRMKVRPDLILQPN